MPEPDFRALFENSPSPVLILSPGLSVVAANDAYCRVAKIDREHILRRSIFDIAPYKSAEPEDITKLRASFERVVRTRRSNTLEFPKFDKHETNDGEGVSAPGRLSTPASSAMTANCNDRLSSVAPTT